MLASAGAAGGVFVIFWLAGVVASIVAGVKILTKAGYSGWWILICLVPIVNFVMFLVFAFSDWPSLQNRGGGYGPPPGGGPTWSASSPPAGSYRPPAAGGYPPPAPGNYPPPQPPPQGP